MKALILYAGLGTRLRPITENIPKPLVLVGNKPLLQYHLDQLKSFDIHDILINSSYLADQIKDFINIYQQHNITSKINLTFEHELLGSAGTLKANWDFFKEEDDFLIIYGDNLTNINYKQFIERHRSKSNLCTIACYQEPEIESKGMVVFDAEDRIQRFVEKPKTDQVVSHYANAGIYVCNKNIIKYLNQFDKIPLDFGYDIFPKILIDQVDILGVYLMKEVLLDVGNLKNYQLAQDYVKKFNF